MLPFLGQVSVWEGEPTGICFPSSLSCKHLWDISLHIEHLLLNLLHTDLTMSLTRAQIYSEAMNIVMTITTQHWDNHSTSPLELFSGELLKS